MKNIKCLLLEDISQVGKKILDREFDLEIAIGQTRNDLLNRISDYHVVVIKGSTIFDKEIFEAASNLKVIARAGTGLDNIDLDLAKSKKINVISTPLANTNSAVEFTITQILCASRNIKKAMEFVAKKDFRRSRLEGTEVQGKVIGLIGLGSVGIGVAKILKTFGAELIAYDPYTSYKDILLDELGGQITNDINEIAKKSNIISLHMNLTKDNKEIINSTFLSLTQYSPILINSARGGLINEKDVIKALDENKLSFYATDFMEPEPSYDDAMITKDLNHPFLEHPGVFYTPHVGASTIEAQDRVAKELVDSILKYFKSEI